MEELPYRRVQLKRCLARKKYTDADEALKAAGYYAARVTRIGAHTWEYEALQKFQYRCISVQRINKPIDGLVVQGETTDRSLSLCRIFTILMDFIVYSPDLRTTSRTRQACELCRQRKTKCTGAKPSW